MTICLIPYAMEHRYKRRGAMKETRHFVHGGAIWCQAQYREAPQCILDPRQGLDAYSDDCCHLIQYKAAAPSERSDAWPTNICGEWKEAKRETRITGITAMFAGGRQRKPTPIIENELNK